MGLFTSEEIHSLEDLLIHEMKDLYDAEKRLVDALPKMQDAATDKQLRDAFRDHLQETKGHVKRLEDAFFTLNKEADRSTCDAMKGLISEGEEAITADAPGDVKDAALIAAAQRVEHYEMAGYGTARNLAQRLGHTSIADLLQKTLDEEGAADKKLTHLAEAHINQRAA